MSVATMRAARFALASWRLYVLPRLVRSAIKLSGFFAFRAWFFRRSTQRTPSAGASARTSAEWLASTTWGTTCKEANQPALKVGM